MTLMWRVGVDAGGYGDPHVRDRALVGRDVAEGKVSKKVAREVYGWTEGV